MQNVKFGLPRLLTIVLVACGSVNKSENLGQVTNENDTTVNNYVLTSTGQTTLYGMDGEVLSNIKENDSLYGQDANYQKGAKMSYTNNGNGTITDNVTGLMWQEVPSDEDFTWQKAVDYCNELELGGYSDWRMPTAKELFSIQNYGKSWPYIDTTYFKLASGMITKDEQFWTSNKYVGIIERGSNSAFGVNAVTGHIKSYSAVSEMPKKDNRPNGDMPPPPQNPNGNMPPPPQNPNGNREMNHQHPPKGNPLAKYVRAVRGDAYGINNFVNNNNGTITDKATGLMWATADNGKGVEWKDALVYAKNSKLAGYSDWRLPNVKELQSIVDYSYSTSSTQKELQKAAINPMFSCTEITNEAGKLDYGYYWTSTSAQFTKGEPYYFAWYVAFGQAVNPNGVDSHGAGAVRFDTKYEGGNLGEGGERYYNYVRLVRDAN